MLFIFKKSVFLPPQKMRIERFEFLNHGKEK
jgi:hypothetical protein